jgi:hypothetical protein
MEYVTTNTEYKDISLLLNTLMRSVTPETPFLNLALGAFGLHYSAVPTIRGDIIEHLVDHILSLNADSSIVEEEARSLFLTAHVLFAEKQWDARLGKHENEIIGYCDRIATLNWLRSPLLASLFLLGFAPQRRFRELVVRAQQYLGKQVERCHENDLPVIIFGLSLVRNSDLDLDDDRISGWLSRQHRPFVNLCLLAVALHGLGHPLVNDCVRLLQDAVFEAYTSTVNPNLSTIRILLAVIHMAEMGQSKEEITATLRDFPLEENVRSRVSAIIRADSHLFIECRDGMLAQAPILSHLSYYLFAASELSIRHAYIISESLKGQFDEFRKLISGKSAKVVSRPLLAVLLTLFVAFASLELRRLWWPLANNIYTVILNSTSNSLIQSYLDDMLKLAILIPLYVTYGCAAAVWLRGSVTWKDLTPSGFRAALYEIASNIGGTIGSKTR